MQSAASQTPRPLSERRVRFGATAKLGWDRIVLIESLPDGDLKTGARLYDDILRPAASERCSLRPVRTRREFLFELEALAREAEATFCRPILHIDAHGTREGVVLASGETVPWGGLVDPLRRINRASRNNLLVVMSTCHGISALVELGTKPTKPVPMRVLVGPADITVAGAVDKGFREFYQALLRTGHLTRAFEALQVQVPNARIIAAEQIFAAGFNNYLTRYCTRRVIVERLNTIVTTSRDVPQALSVNDTRRRARRALTEGMDDRFASFKRVFFMTDVWPELEDRFVSVILE